MTTGFRTSGGEGGIRTLGTGVSPYNGLANRRIRPLCRLSGVQIFILPRRQNNRPLPYHSRTPMRPGNLMRVGPGTVTVLQRSARRIIGG